METQKSETQNGKGAVSNLSDIQLEERICINDKCNISFRVLPHDKQIGCHYHESSITPRERDNYWKARGGMPCPIKIKIKSVPDGKKDMRTIQNTVKDTEQKGERTTIKTKRELMRKIDLNTMPIKKREISNEVKEEGKIQTQQKSSESGMQKTESERPQNNEKENTVETQSSDSQNQSKNMSLVPSYSMNLIDDSANHLFKLMTGLEKPNIKEMIDNPKTYETERVKTAVGCAKEIRELMKLKLDAIKTVREILKEEGSNNGSKGKISNSMFNA